MKRPPVIGITTYAGHDRARYNLPVEYVSAVERAGGLPVLIPPVPDMAPHYLALLDGLVLAGGGDIDPARYGGTQHATLYMVDAARDELELRLARDVLESGMPTLAICRGMQVVNLALGGTLIEHLPDVVGDSVQHRKPPRDPVPHPVRVEPDSRLAAVVGATTLMPMSWHHQGVRRLGAGLKVVAHASDDTIEGVELPSHPWLLGVQWHPELTAERDATQQRLFDALVKACGGHR